MLIAIAKNKRNFIIAATIVVLIAGITASVLFILHTKGKKQTAEFNKQGLIKFASGDNSGAIEDFNKAIAVDPKSASVYLSRGKARSALGDNNGAIEDFNKAIELDPNAMAYYNRGKIKSDLGDRTGAIEDYNKAIELNPSFKSKLQSAIEIAGTKISLQKPAEGGQKPADSGQKPAEGGQKSTAQQKTEAQQKAGAPIPKMAITNELDSWYKVTSPKGDHIGWMNEKISRLTPTPTDKNKRGGFSYVQAGEIAAGNSSIFGTAKATFDNSFKMVEFETVLASNGEQVVSRLASDKKGRRIEVVLPDDSKEVTPLTDKDEIFPSEEVALYSLTQRELLKDGLNEFKMIDEERGGIITMQVDVSKTTEKRVIMEKNHILRHINILQHYECYIDKYGRMAEVILPGNIRTVLVGGEEDAKGKFGISPRGRRNPFVRPQIRGEEGPHETTIKATEFNKQNLIGQLEDALKDMDEKKDNKEEFDNAYAKLTTLYKALTTSGLLKEGEKKRIKVSREKAEKLHPKAEATYNFAEGVYSAMQDAFKQEDYKGVGEQFKKLQDILAYPEIYGTTYEGDAKGLLEDGGKLAKRAIDRLYIQGRNFNISGIFYYIDPTNVPSSYAIINGKSYKEKDEVEGENGIFVKKIEKSDVIMGYNEEDVTVSIKRSQ